MIDFLPGIVEVVLLVFCLIDCIQTDELLIRNLPSKVIWILLIILLPILGSVAWLVAGRPWQPQPGRNVAWRSTSTAGYPDYERPAAASNTGDIDERLRRDQERVDREHEEALRKWEASLRERERRLGDGGTES